MREVTINGKTVILETKAPPPKIMPRGTKPKGELRLLCEAMQDGESAFINLPTYAAKQQLSGRLNGISKVLGCKFVSRTEGNGARIFRIAKPDAKPNGRAYSVQTVKTPQSQGWLS